jgi:two-component system sporulation sensor kinase B
MLFCLLALALLTAMTFPVNLEGVVYDFRSVPIALGVLYGGPSVGAGLVATAVAYRHFLDYPLTALYAVSLFTAVAAVSLLCRKLKPFSGIPQKVLFSMLICTMIKLITFTIYLTATGQLALLVRRPSDDLKTYLLQAAIVGLCVYLIEFLERYYNMQEELVRTEKASIVSHIAASVAHEIRNPLTSVRGFIQLFGNDNLDPAKRQYYQKMCLEELDRAQHIITDYLALAKPDPEVVEPININEELNYIANVLQSYANFSNTEIVKKLDAGPAPVIIGDRSKLRQTLINIGKNSIEAMPEGGLLEMKVEKKDRNVVVTIKDNGVGMTNEQIKRLGTPYYSTKEKGTGLGTMVSFNIIRRMNGSIDIKSEVGKGTSFQIVFPSEYK